MIVNSTEPGDPPRIRETGLSVWVVYRSLAWGGMSDETVLDKYPALELGDLAAVRDYVAKSIKSRTQDEFTGRPILTKGLLRHGAYYKGRCRNATIARWNGEEQCFYHWRDKLGRIFIQTIRYPTDELEPWWDVFDVVEELPACKFEIPFDLEATFCGNHDDLVEYHPEMWSRPAR
jgi:uncharacterized protein (DUF433 family)